MAEAQEKRLLALRGLFAGPAPICPDDLYSQVVQGIADRQRNRLRLEQNTRVTTNTYFGRFPATYWQHWTSARDVVTDVTVTGSGRIRLMASDTNKIPRTVAAQDVVDARDVTLQLVGPIDRFVDGGGMWLEFSTASGTLDVSDVRWSVPQPETVAPANIVICTYNRVSDCLATLGRLLSDPEVLGLVEHVYVVDQGSDPLADHPEFDPIREQFGAALRYLRQPNLGGAGGFTRGIFESIGPNGRQGHVLLMDDDVECEPDVVTRLTAFANSCTTPAIVGGQMLNLLHPTFLHIGAEYADMDTLVAGKPVKDSLQETDLLGLDERGLPNVQERRLDGRYNGWWTCLIPTSIVQAIGYPLPVFFQWDDIEFGYRAREHGFPTVTLPNAGLWHADFFWKDWDEWHRYFNLRNALITACLHSEFNVNRHAANLAGLLARQLVSMHYGLSATLLKAVNDFLDGPDFLADGGVSAASDIRKVRAAYPETVVHPSSAVPVPDAHVLPIVRYDHKPSRTTLVWMKRMVYHLLGKAVHPRGAVPAGDAHWWHVSLFDEAIVTDSSEQGVRIRKRDRETMLRLAREGATTLRRFRAEARTVQARYRAAMPELTSRANWARLYGLDDGQ